MISEIRAELADLSLTPNKLRSFGLLFSAIFGIWTTMKFFKGVSHWELPVALSAVFLLSAIFFPKVLKQPYRVWMALGLLLGWFMIRILLTVMFFLVITPIGLLLRAINRDLLDQTMIESTESHWKRHVSAKGKEQYRKQF